LNGNHNKKGASPTSGDGLATAVKLWATPQSRDFRTGEGHRWENPDRSRNLNDQVAHANGVKLWPTPTSRDHKDVTDPATWDCTEARERYDQLGRAIYNPAMGPAPTIGALNPDWVEWLMGYPTGWTTLNGRPKIPRSRVSRSASQTAPTDSAPSGTRLSPRSRKKSSGRSGG
jgi:hypothetical protein